MKKAIVCLLLCLLLVLPASTAFAAADTDALREYTQAVIEEEQYLRDQAQTYLYEAQWLLRESILKDDFVDVPADMADFWEVHSIHTIDDPYHRFMEQDEWREAIEGLERFIACTDEYIALLQGYMDSNFSYSYLSSVSRGQTMFGGAETGFGVTALVLGLALGCGGTLVVQKLLKKKGQA